MTFFEALLSEFSPRPGRKRLELPLVVREPFFRRQSVMLLVVLQKKLRRVIPSFLYRNFYPKSAHGNNNRFFSFNLLFVSLLGYKYWNCCL